MTEMNVSYLSIARINRTVRIRPNHTENGLAASRLMIAVQTSSTVSPKRSFMAPTANGEVGRISAGLLLGAQAREQSFL